MNDQQTGKEFSFLPILFIGMTNEHPMGADICSDDLDPWSSVMELGWAISEENSSSLESNRTAEGEWDATNGNSRNQLFDWNDRKKDI